jgi:hypothetical protein
MKERNPQRAASENHIRQHGKDIPKCMFLQTPDMGSCKSSSLSVKCGRFSKITEFLAWGKKEQMWETGQEGFRAVLFSARPSLITCCGLSQTWMGDPGQSLRTDSRTGQVPRNRTNGWLRTCHLHGPSAPPILVEART